MLFFILGLATSLFSDSSDTNYYPTAQTECSATFHTPTDFDVSNLNLNDLKLDDHVVNAFKAFLILFEEYQTISKKIDYLEEPKSSSFLSDSKNQMLVSSCTGLTVTLTQALVSYMNSFFSTLKVAALDAVSSGGNPNTLNFHIITGAIVTIATQIYLHTYYPDLKDFEFLYQKRRELEEQMRALLKSSPELLKIIFSISKKEEIFTKNDKES